MGIFPGAKAYFRDTTKVFSNERNPQKPNVIVTDVMLLLYMFDAYRSIKESESTAYEPYVGSMRSLARFLWRRIAHPDNAEQIETWQTHVVTFDVPGCSPRAKEATQIKRSTRSAPSIEGEFHDFDDDAPLPKPFSTCLRTPGFLGKVVERLFPLLEEMYVSCKSFWGDLILQWRNIPTRLFRHSESGVASRELLQHAHSVTSIGEGDMSICYWVQYFNADATLIITKDTDMILLLSLVAPSKGKTLTLRLDYGVTIDYIDIVSFQSWLATRYGSVYDGFIYCVLQGNDYVEKVTKGCGPVVHLDTLAERCCMGQAPVMRVHNGTFECNEHVLKARLQTACVRGSLIPTADVCIRQALWYLFYALHAVNGSNMASNMCASMHNELSLFGWTTSQNNTILHASRVTQTPSFSLTN